jgi:hypothetical protein
MPQDLNDLGQPIGFALDDWKPPPRPPSEPMAGRYCRVEPLDPDRHAADLYDANALDTEGRIWTYLPYGPFASREEFDTHLEAQGASQDPLFVTTPRAIADATRS